MQAANRVSTKKHTTNVDLFLSLHSMHAIHVLVMKCMHAEPNAELHMALDTFASLAPQPLIELQPISATAAVTAPASSLVNVVPPSSFLREL